MGNAASLKHHVETAEKIGVIQLAKTNLRDIPNDVIQSQLLIEKLRSLDLSSNRLKRLSENIGSFQNLKLLNLSSNRIAHISPAIGQLTKLETLQLENNNLEYLPEQFFSLINLKTLDLSFNQFKIFPKQVCQLENLELLVLANNQIDSLPDEIGQCKASEINLDNNKITRLNDALATCPRLKILRLDRNLLELASITKPILSDSKICLLSVENNKFTMKQFQARDGYDDYIQRYTSTKRKLL